MEHRLLGGCGLKVPALSFGTATFGGGDAFFKAWGDTDVAQAQRLIDLCLEAGVTLFDTADLYSQGLAEKILGQALGKRRDQVLISSKCTFRVGDGPNDVGSSRFHIVRACEASLRRLGTDHIDLYHMHGFDPLSPVEETLRALDDLVTAGKVRYIACSNFSGWHLMKSLAVSDRYGWSRYVAHQAYYSLLHREFEWELMPLACAENVATMVWSPLGWGRLTGKLGRDLPMPTRSRLHATSDAGPPTDEAHLYRVTDALADIASDTGRSVPQIALSWLLRRPSVASVIIGARDEAQLRDNLGAASCKLDDEHMARLERASNTAPTYPYWHQHQFAERQKNL